MAARDTQGQRHDRIPDWPDHADIDVDLNGGLQPPEGLEGRQTPEHTSITQKMVAAVSGSVLTSFIVTPLDVVRVRLQANQSPSPSTHRLPSFLQMPPNLGVTACCREVFWVHNHSQFCVATAGHVLEESGGSTASVTSAMNSSAATSARQAARLVPDCAAEETQRRTFNSTLDGLRKIARNEGIHTLWRGLSPTLLMSVPANVIYFAGYDWLRTSPHSPMAGKVSDAYAPLVAGSFARGLAAMAVSPLEMLRTRMQASRSAERGVLRTTITGLRDMVSHEGFPSLWRGLTLTLWRDVPFSALYWWGYEFGRARLHEVRSVRGGSGRHATLTHTELLTDSFLAGAVSGAIAAFVTTPFDVGKTRQQTVIDSNLPIEQRRALPESKSMPRFLQHIYRTDGLAGLFKGSGARCLKVAPACAIMISSYEIGKKMAVKPLGKDEDDRR